MIIIGNMTRYDTTLAASTDTGSDSTRSTGWVENTVGDHSVYHDNHHPITDHDNHDHQYNDHGCIRTGPGYGGQESEALYQELEPHYQSLDQVIDCFVFFFCKIVNDDCNRFLFRHKPWRWCFPMERWSLPPWSADNDEHVMSLIS